MPISISVILDQKCEFLSCLNPEDPIRIRTRYNDIGYKCPDNYPTIAKIILSGFDKVCGDLECSFLREKETDVVPEI